MICADILIRSSECTLKKIVLQASGPGPSICTGHLSLYSSAALSQQIAQLVHISSRYHRRILAQKLLLLTYTSQNT